MRVYAVRPADAQQSFICLKKLDNKFIDITGKTDAEKSNKGEYYLFKKTFYYKSPWYGGFSYVDLMAKGVTEKFIDVTMGAYEKVFGKEFGKTALADFLTNEKELTEEKIINAFNNWRSSAEQTDDICIIGLRL